MANAIKDFFKKKKLDAKFKIAGSGQRLTDSQNISSATSSATASTPVVSSSQTNSSNVNRNNRKDMSTKMAAEAAIERIQRQQQTNYTKTNTLENILREERQKISEEYKMKEKVESLVKDEEKLEKRYQDMEVNQRFSCPTIGSNESFPIEELMARIEDYIQTNFAEDLTLMSVLTLINCNFSTNDEYKQRIQECINTLDKIVTNLGNSSPEEREKFKRIRKSKIQKKVIELKGGLEFLVSIGFELDSSEEWLVFSEDQIPDISEQMVYYKDVLNSAQQFPIVLDRQLTRLERNPSETEDLNNDFFKLSTDEVIREIHSLTEKRETEETLRTKAMREQRHRKIDSKYSRLRFKFPNGLQIEATFGSNETLKEVKDWLSERSDSVKEFDLKCIRDLFRDEHLNKTLKDLSLVPTATLIIISKDN